MRPHKNPRHPSHPRHPWFVPRSVPSSSVPSVFSVVPPDRASGRKANLIISRESRICQNGILIISREIRPLVPQHLDNLSNKPHISPKNPPRLSSPHSEFCILNSELTKGEQMPLSPLA